MSASSVGRPVIDVAELIVYLYPSASSIIPKPSLWHFATSLKNLQVGLNSQLLKLKLDQYQMLK